MNKIIKKIAALPLLLSFMLPQMTSAAIYSTANKNNSFDVSLTVVPDCSITANPLNFGSSQGNLSTAINAMTTIAVTCSNNTLYNIGLNSGTGVGSVGTTRYMSGTGANTDKIQFNLFQLPGNTIWGNIQGTDVKPGIGNGVTQTLNVYGQVPAQATPQPDTYKSTITATVFF